jgi:Na+-transporting NADH:ubiquinone oxidoreductase subunit C
MSRETLPKTLGIAFGLCVVCSLLVSAAAVSLRPMQEANKLKLTQREILKAAGVYDPNESKNPVSKQFEQIDTKLINLATGEPVKEGVVDPATYDPVKAASDPKLSVAIPPDKDVAGIKRREKYEFVYFLKDGEGGFSKVILPIYGKGLWSTMYGYLALEKDLKTVAGITFYKDGETPGLGGEINNPNWQKSWVGKVAREKIDGELQPVIDVVKGGVKEGSPGAEHEIDALSGATITSNGVQNTIAYWLGEDGFEPFLKHLSASDGHISESSDSEEEGGK